MATLNHVFISGFTTRDPETRFVGSGTALCTLAVAVPRSYQVDDQWKKETSFVDVKCWGETAKQASEYLHKGVEVAVQGRLEQERWQAQDGSARSKLVIVADKVDLISQPKASRQAESGNDIPF